MGIFQKCLAPLALKRVRFDLAPDCHINLRELSSQELIDFQSKMGSTETSNLDFVFDLISKCAVDDDGKPLFADAADVRATFNVGLSTLIEIQKAVMSLSGIDTPKN